MFEIIYFTRHYRKYFCSCKVCNLIPKILLFFFKLFTKQVQSTSSVYPLKQRVNTMKLNKISTPSALLIITIKNQQKKKNFIQKCFFFSYFSLVCSNAHWACGVKDKSSIEIRIHSKNLWFMKCHIERVKVSRILTISCQLIETETKKKGWRDLIR